MAATQTLERAADAQPTRPAALAVLDAAARCFAERGFAATSVDDVARRLNATKGRVYHHYASKTDLFFAVYRRGMDLNFAALARVADAPPVPRLRAMCVAHAETIMREQAFQRVIVEGVFLHRFGTGSPRHHDELRRLIDLRDDYERLFRAAIEDATGRDGAIAVKSCLAVLNSTVFWYRERTPAERPALAHELAETAIAGLRIPTGEDR